MVFTAKCHGPAFRQEEFTKAMQMYTRFTIGDGLLAQLPSLFISVATGLVVTRSASTGSFGKDITDQFARNSTVYYIAAITLCTIHTDSSPSALSALGENLKPPPSVG